MTKFTGQIVKLGINSVIDPPQKVLDEIFQQAHRSKGPIPVLGRLNDAKFTQTLVKYRGAWRLYINGPMLKDSRSTVGDVVEIEIEFDPRPRSTPVPDKLAAAFRKDFRARQAFENLSPSRRKEIMRYIGSLKTPDAITRNVEKIVAHLRGEKVDHVLTRSKPRR